MSVHDLNAYVTCICAQVEVGTEYFKGTGMKP